MWCDVMFLLHRQYLSIRCKQVWTSGTNLTREKERKRGKRWKGKWERGERKRKKKEKGKAKRMRFIISLSYIAQAEREWSQIVEGDNKFQILYFLLLFFFAFSYDWLCDRPNKCRELSSMGYVEREIRYEMDVNISLQEERRHRHNHMHINTYSTDNFCHYRTHTQEATAMDVNT